MIKVNNFPSWVILEITDRCNLKCKHCYLSSTFKGNDIKPELIQKLKKEFKKNKLDVLAITGGECFLNKNLIDFIKIFSPLTKVLILETNLTLIDKKIIEEFKKYKNLIVQTSIEGIKNPFNRMPTKFILNKLLLLQNNGINHSLLFTISNKSKGEILQISKYAKILNANLGIERFIPVGRGSSKFNLSKKDFSKICSLCNEQRINCSDPLALKSKNKKTNIGCSAGIFACCISSKGEVYPCAKLRIKIGDLNQSSLKGIWNNSQFLNKLRNREKYYNPQCKKCKSLNQCGGCRAHAMAKFNDPFAIDPLCEFYS